MKLFNLPLHFNFSSYFTAIHGVDRYRQESGLISKHVGEGLLTPYKNGDRNTNGENNYALAA